MRRLLAASVLLAFMPALHAQDKGKSDLSHSAEFRLRDTFEQNEAGNSNLQPAHHNGVDQRFKLGLKFKANEKFSANATLLQSASWGQASGDTTVGDRGTVTGGHEPNVLSVNEAYATWMMSEDLHAKFGRQNFGFGDGAVMSINDYQMQPNSFDGVAVHYEAEFGRFTGFTWKYRDYSGAQGTNNLPATTSDATHNAYGMVFDLKTMPEWLKAVSVNVIKDAGDSVWDSATDPTVHTLQNMDTLRYGVMGSFNWGAVDLKADYEMVNGKDSRALTPQGTISDANKHDVSQNMYQAELGFNMPNLMMSRFYFGYHHDSGTDKNDIGVKHNTYDGYFYEKHTGSGLMELVGWGNLTDITLGWTVKPTDSTDAGVAYSMLSKTVSEDAVHAGTYGGQLFLPARQTLGAGKSASSKIGDEIDLWAEHRYDGGLAMMGRLGYFSPGSALKDTVANQKDAIMQVFVQGKLTF